MLVVVAIIAILAALLLPSLNRALESSRALLCMNNMRGLSLKVLTFSDENNGCLPAFVGSSKNSSHIHEAFPAPAYLSGTVGYYWFSNNASNSFWPYLSDYATVTCPSNPGRQTVISIMEQASSGLGRSTYVVSERFSRWQTGTQRMERYNRISSQKFMLLERNATGSGNSYFFRALSNQTDIASQLGVFHNGINAICFGLNAKFFPFDHAPLNWSDPPFVSSDF